MFEKRINYFNLNLGISFTFILFLLCCAAYSFFIIPNLNKNESSQFQFLVIVKDSVSNEEIKSVERMFDSINGIYKYDFINKEQALKELQNEINEDFISFLGTNPLNSFYEIKLNSSYLHIDSVINIEKKIKKNFFIQDTNYKPEQLNIIKESIRKTSVLLLTIGFILSIISILLLYYFTKFWVFSKVSKFKIAELNLIDFKKNCIKTFLIIQLISNILSILLFILTCTFILNVFHIEVNFNIFAKISVMVIIVSSMINFMYIMLICKNYIRLYSKENN